MLSPVCAFQTRAVLSAPAVTINRESGLNDALFTWPVWPSSFLTTSPRFGSHTHAVSALAATVYRPSELYSTLETGFGYVPPIIRTCSNRLASHSRTVASLPAVTMNLPSGRNDALLTLPLGPRSSPRLAPVAASQTRAVPSAL